MLRTVRGNDDAQFVPYLAVTTGVGLAMLSLGVLIFFIHHVAISIQATQVIANVAHDLDGAIARLFPDQISNERVIDHSLAAAAVPSFDGAHAVTSTREGYIQAIESRRLLKLVRDRDLVVRLDAEAGAFVRAGTTLLSVVGETRQVRDEMHESLRATFIIGSEPTGTQDVGFFIHQLVELAVRALSPGINDPATARACIDRLEAALGQLAGRRMPAAHRHDEAGRLRVVARPVTLAMMVEQAFMEIARYGRSSVSVSCRLLHAVRDLASSTLLTEDRQALLRLAAFIGDRSGDPAGNDTDRSELAACWRAAVAALQERPVPDVLAANRAS